MTNQQGKSENLIGAILAGGKGRRLGERDKALIELNQTPLYEYATRKLSAMTDELIILSPERPSWIENCEAVRWVQDEQFPETEIGPAGGLLAALSGASQTHGASSWVVTVPVDAPFFPETLLDRLAGALDDKARVAIVRCDGRLHPTFGLWSADLVDEVRQLVEDGNRALHRIATEVGAIEVLFDKPEAFLNINTLEDLARAETLLNKT
ncbi:MAG: hypothetical protein CMK09_07605 [Ponticaulis sp.]|nr:hypothetical protein [Ponticaulis sp.]|tara:strand:- start:8106 stop:8735 length:630 start_codon:yes stop_codon:yes gene_type:complete